MTTCRQCGESIDRATLDWFARKRPGRTPSLCGGCLLGAFDRLFVAGGLEPMLPGNWRVVRPEADHD